jgi:cell division septation protein DedD
MSRNEEGEFELVLGNRQLLSIFFIVVILFGVFFTMGYIVGRNSAPSVAMLPPPAKSADSAAGRAPAAAPAAEPASQPAGTPAAPQDTPVETQPAQAPAEQEAAPAGTARREEQPAQTEEAKAAPHPTQVEPGPGRVYLQVAAVGRPDAELEVRTLRKRGFPALVAPGPREDVFRVLVGPYRDAAALGKAKADLEALGFKPIVRK